MHYTMFLKELCIVNFLISQYSIYSLQCTCIMSILIIHKYTNIYIQPEALLFVLKKVLNSLGLCQMHNIVTEMHSSRGNVKRLVSYIFWVSFVWLCGWVRAAGWLSATEAMHSIRRPLNFSKCCDISPFDNWANKQGVLESLGNLDKLGASLTSALTHIINSSPTVAMFFTTFQQAQFTLPLKEKKQHSTHLTLQTTGRYSLFFLFKFHERAVFKQVRVILVH